MPLNNTPTPTHSPEEFCLALKAEREKKGITLAEIEKATKIPVSVFVALERGDLRRWPKGIFKRSFFRGYVTKIGVPVEDACAEFLRLFPDEEPVELAATVQQPSEPANDDSASPLARLGNLLVEAISNVFGSVSSPDNTQEPEMRGWVTDARRVGPPPRLRVRIKLPK
jgi:transcriptional regulator with XRE-family HTH domain